MVNVKKYMVTTFGTKTVKKTFIDGIQAKDYYDRACKRAKGRTVIMESYIESIEDMKNSKGVYVTYRFKTNARILYQNNPFAEKYRDESKRM